MFSNGWIGSGRRLFTKTLSTAIGQPTAQTHPHLLGPGHVTYGIGLEEFRQRRQRLLDTLQPGNVAIIPGFALRYASQNIFYPFHQNPNLLYLTGFGEPQGCLILEKISSAKGKSIMFVREDTKESRLWDGPRAGTHGTRQYFGVEETHPIGLLELFIEDVCDRSSAIFADLSPNVILGPESTALLSERVEKKSQSLAPMLQKHRVVKSPSELEVMKDAGRVAAEAFADTMSFSKVQRMEATLAARMEYECRLRGAQSLSYVPVVAGGDRALTLHYVRNDQMIRDNDMLLMDAGAMFHGYCSDISRTWPANGIFSHAQRELYQAVLDVQTACIKKCAANQQESLASLNAYATDLFIVELARLGFTDPGSHIDRLFPHSIGHYLGMDLHDCPTIPTNTGLVEGMVITIEPGLYIPHESVFPEQYRGIGIRIEDDVLVGKHEPVVFTEAAPKEIAQIEQCMAR